MNEPNAAPSVGVTDRDQHMAQIFAMGVQAGILSAMQTPIPVSATDEKGHEYTVHITPAQLMHNLSESLENCGAMLDVNNQIAEEALEEQAPPRRRKR